MFSIEAFMIPCLNKKLFGFECMGCGLQRSISLIFHGDFIAAFYMYPAIYSLIALFGCMSINIFFKFKNASLIINSLAILSVSIIIINYIIKLIN